MVIKFKLDDYYEICDEYWEVFENDDTVDVRAGDDTLVLSTKRIVIPDLHASFREGTWLSGSDDDMETQDSVWVQYEEAETNPANFISYANCELMYFADELCRSQDIVSRDVSELECYIDTKEFISDTNK